MSRINEKQIHHVIIVFFIILFTVSVIWAFSCVWGEKRGIVLVNDYAWNDGNDLSWYATYEGEAIEIDIPEGEDVNFDTQQDVLKF